MVAATAVRPNWALAKRTLAADRRRSASHPLNQSSTIGLRSQSLVLSATSRIVERALLQRYPEHRKVVKTVGWIQRITVASLMSYHLSAPHYRQAQVNTQRAAELGLR